MLPALINPSTIFSNDRIGPSRANMLLPTDIAMTGDETSNGVRALRESIQQFRDDTEVDLVLHPFLAGISSPESLFAVLDDHLRTCKSYSKQKGRVRGVLNPVVDHVERIVRSIGSREVTELGPLNIVFAAIGQVILMTKDDGAAYDSLLRVFTELGTVLNDLPSDSGSGSISLHAEDILVEVLAGIITLMGHSYKALNSGLAWRINIVASDAVKQDFSIAKHLAKDGQWAIHSLEHQFKRDWADCNDEYRSNAGVDTLSSDFPLVPSTQALFSLLSDQLRPRKKNAVRVRNALPPVLRSIEQVLSVVPPVEGLICEPKKAVFGAIALLIITAGKDEASFGVIIDLIDRVQDQLARATTITGLDQYEPSDAFMKISARIIAQLLVVLGTSTKTLKEHRLRLRMLSISKLNQNLYSTDLPVQQSVSELGRLVAKAVSLIPTSASGASFTTVWKAAVKKYQSDTGIDIKDDRTFQNIDSLESLMKAVTEAKYNFQDFRRRHGEIRDVIQPVARFVMQFRDIGAEVLPFNAGKILFGAISTFLQAANMVSASYDTVQKLFKDLDTILSRLSIYLSLQDVHQLNDVVTKILGQLLVIFGLATKKESRTGRYIGFLLGQKDQVQDALTELRRLQDEEHGMVDALTLAGVHSIKHDMQTALTGLSPEIKNILQHIHKTSVHHDEEGFKIYSQDEIDPLHEIPVQGVVKYSIARTGQDKVVVKRFPRRDAAFEASVGLLKQNRHRYYTSHLMGYTLVGDPYIVMRAGCFTFQDVFKGVSLNTWQQKQQLLRCVIQMLSVLGSLPIDRRTWNWAAFFSGDEKYHELLVLDQSGHVRLDIELLGSLGFVCEGIPGRFLGICQSFTKQLHGHFGQRLLRILESDTDPASELEQCANFVNQLVKELFLIVGVYNMFMSLAVPKFAYFVI